MHFPLPDINITKRWVFKDLPSQHKIIALAQSINVNPTIAGLLVQRGIDDFDKAKNYFRPELSHLHDPFLMKDMDKATNRLLKAINNGEKILIYGDYDVDGTTSVSLVYAFLQNYYAHLAYYLPDRYAEGYGLSEQGVQWAAEKGYSLIITLDCGIKAHEKIVAASELGIDIIVCDHHLPPEGLPPAYAVLDPKRTDCAYPYKELSGCGVGFKFMQAFCIRQNVPLEELLAYIDLLAVSIAADIVPITGENRTLAYFGLQKLNENPIAGLAALKEVAAVRGELTISGIVFTIGPRINAAGRIEHAKAAVDLLTSRDKQQAIALAEEIEQNNNNRRAVDSKITDEAIAMIETNELMLKANSTVLYKADWHKGVIGIVASRCIEKYYRPTIILTESNGKATGSARSVDGFDLYSAINQCSELLEQFGGHTHAAGLTLAVENIAAFSEKFEEIVSNGISDKLKEAPLEIDYKLKLDAVNEKMLNILKQMEPFGPDNLQPVFYSEDLNVVSIPQLLKGEHLKFKVKQQGSEQTLEVIGFGMKEFYEPLCSGHPFMMAFHIDENNFKGISTIQLRAKDIRFC